MTIKIKCDIDNLSISDMFGLLKLYSEDEKLKSKALKIVKKEYLNSKVIF